VVPTPPGRGTGWGGWHRVAGVRLGGEEALSLGTSEMGLGRRRRTRFPFSAGEAAAFPGVAMLPSPPVAAQRSGGTRLVSAAVLRKQLSLGKNTVSGRDPSTKS